jgi:hypothetical protein
MRKILLAALLAAAATPAFAADLTKTSAGYTYFNMPGADLAAHDAAVRDCRVISRGVYQPNTQPAVYAPGLAGAIGAAIAQAIIQAVIEAKAKPIYLENCMVVKGWRVVALDPVAGDAIDKLDDAAKAARMAPLVGAEQPEGVVVRVFANDAARQTTGMFTPAANLAKARLSVDAMGKPPEEDKSKPAPGPKMKRTARPPKPLKAEQLGGIPADSALIVVNVRGVGALSVQFIRIGPDNNTPAWVDGRPAEITAAQAYKATATAGGPNGTTVVFAVPPGRWRLDAFTAGLFRMDFCMGAPAFDVAVGEVVYAGTFDPASDSLLPSNLIDDAKAVFPAGSGLAEKVRPASYINGNTSKCYGAFAYALEVPGQPFADGYRMGTLAQPPVAPAAMTPTPVDAPVAAPADAPVTPAAPVPAAPAQPTAAPPPATPAAIR